MLDDLNSENDRRLFTRRGADQGDRTEPSVVRQIGIALAVLSLGGSVFTAGYNWRSVAILEGNQGDFVRKDVQAERLERVNERLSEISRQLEELRGELRATRRKD